MNSLRLHFRCFSRGTRLLFIFLCAPTIFAQTWTFKNPLPTGNTINGMASNGSLVVGVGQCGAIITSSNGTSWNSAASPTTRNLRAIAYTGSLFIAVGDNGTVLTSGNGTAWTPATSNTSADLLCVAAGLAPGKIAAGGIGGAVITSSDGVSWTAATSGTTADLFACTVGGTTAVMTGGNGAIITSTNATAWTNRNSGTSADLFAVAYNGSRFCAVGGGGTALVSADGAVWSAAAVPSSEHLYGICGKGDTLIAAGANGTIAVSANGLATWNLRASGLTRDFRCVVNSAAGIIAAGCAGIIVRGASSVAFTRIGAYAANDINGIATNGGTTGNAFVAAGKQGLILTSTDGISWTQRTSGTKFDLTSVAFGSGRYVAVGQHGTLCTSADGATWSYDSIISRWSDYNDLYKVKWLQDRFMAAGGWGTLQFSSTGAPGTWALCPNIPAQDSITGGWGPTAYNTKEYRSMCRTRNKFIVVGDYGMISYGDTSSTNPGWANVPYFVHDRFCDVAWTGTRAIAVGAAGTIVRSADGISWSIVPCSSSVALTSVIWTGDTLFAFGERGTVLLSSDTGATWHARSSGTDNTLNYGVAANQTILSVGDNGSILSGPTTGGVPAPFVKADSLIVPYAPSVNRGIDTTSRIFPSKAMAIDVTKPPYNADRTGQIDASDAIQRAIDTSLTFYNYHFAMVVVYLPNGTYRVSKTLQYKLPINTEGPHMQGQSRSGTVIRLADSTWWRGDEAKPVISTGDGVAQNFNRGLRYLTVNTGRKNPGAIGVYFYGNNESLLSDVDIISEDGQGQAGLHLGYVEQGPAGVRRVYIRGFDVGIQSQAKNSVTLMQITLECQRRYGIVNQYHPLFIDSLRSYNKVTAILNQTNGAMTLVDANLTGGLPDRSAVVNTTGATLFARNVTATGYRRAIENTSFGALSPTGLSVSEWVSEGRLSLFPNAPQHSLNLPKKYPPEPAWENDSAKWAFVKDYRTGARTWAQALQAAIDDPTKTTVCIPAFTYPDTINDTVRLRGTITRLIGTGGSWKGTGAIVVEDGSAPVVKLERLTGTFTDFPIFVRTARTAVFESWASGPVFIQGGGEVYMTDVVVDVTVDNPTAKLWIHYFDGEGNNGCVLNQRAGTTRVFGWKDEGFGTTAHVTGGSFEALGFMQYANQAKSDTSAMFWFANANASIAGAVQVNYAGSYYDVLVRQTQNGVTKEIKTAQNQYGPSIPLFVASADGVAGNRVLLRKGPASFSIAALTRRCSTLICRLTSDQKQNVSLRLINAQGRIAKSANFRLNSVGPQSVTLELPHLAHGMYYVQLTPEKGKALKQIMW
jgi:hypothetical protein